MPVLLYQVKKYIPGTYITGIRQVKLKNMLWGMGCLGHGIEVEGVRRLLRTSVLS